MVVHRMVWGEMWCGVLDMLVYHGERVAARCSAMGLRLFSWRIMGNFLWEMLGISRTPPHSPLFKVDGTPVL